jgi:hypothetical protein
MVASVTRHCSSNRLQQSHFHTGLLNLHICSEGDFLCAQTEVKRISPVCDIVVWHHLMHLLSDIEFAIQAECKYGSVLLVLEMLFAYFQSVYEKCV